MARMIPTSAPRAIHRGESELPFVALGDGTHLQLLQVDIPSGLWVVRTRFEPGVTIPTHRHTGPVYAFTLAGRKASRTCGSQSTGQT
jgi:quercetin dioxygenase-like cupin family protein